MPENVLIHAAKIASKLSFKWSELSQFSNGVLIRAISAFPLYGYYIIYNEKIGNIFDTNSLTDAALQRSFLTGNQKFLSLFIGSLIIIIFLLIYHFSCPSEIKRSKTRQSYIDANYQIFSKLFVETSAEYLFEDYQFAAAGKKLTHSYNGNDLLYRIVCAIDAHPEKYAHYLDVSVRLVDVIGSLPDLKDEAKQKYVILDNFFAAFDMSKMWLRFICSSVLVVGGMLFLVPTFDLIVHVLGQAKYILFE